MTHASFTFFKYFSTVCNHGSSSSIKGDICHQVGGRRRTSVIFNGKRKHHTNHYTSKPVATPNNQKTIHIGPYPSFPIEPIFPEKRPVALMSVENFRTFFIHSRKLMMDGLDVDRLGQFFLGSTERTLVHSSISALCQGLLSTNHFQRFPKKSS